MSAKDALERYITKTEKSAARKLTNRGKKNKSPEKDLVKALLVWLKNNEFDCNVVESKATFSQATGLYTGRVAVAGFPDIVGNWKNGLATYIEVKAPGRISTLRELQRDFLLKKINSNCFAVCVDSVYLLDHLWEEYTASDRISRQRYLLDQLPTKKADLPKSQTSELW